MFDEVFKYVGYLSSAIGVGGFLLKLLAASRKWALAEALRPVVTLALVVGIVAWSALGVSSANEKWHLFAWLSGGPVNRQEHPLPTTDEEQRQVAVQSLANSLRSMMSSDAKEAAVASIPTIKGGIRGGELANITRPMMSADARYVIEDTARYIIYPLEDGELQALTKHLMSSDASACVAVLTKMQKAASE